MGSSPRRGFHVVFAVFAFCLWSLAALSPAAAEPWLDHYFADADQIVDADEEIPVQAALRDGEIVGYVFETVDFAPIPAYSAKPVNMRVGLDLDGRVTGVEVLEHHEPIMLVGIPETRLDEFVEQYRGKSVDERVRVGLSRRVREGQVTVDAVSGATVTVVVMGDSIMRAARIVANELGIRDIEAVARQEAEVRQDVFEPMDWEELKEAALLGHLYLTWGEVDEAFVGTEAEDVDVAPEGQEEETFIDLYFGYLDVPTIGRNLLGDERYERLMERLDEDERAFFVGASGRYSFKGHGFARGGIFDRFQFVQGDSIIQFRDTDMIRLYNLDPAVGRTDFREQEIFVMRSGVVFDPGMPYDFELLVMRQYAPLDSEFVSFDASHEIPDDYILRPEPPPDEDRPLWISVWEDRVFHIVVLVAGLLVLTLILLFQDVLARRPVFLWYLRKGFLIYTIVFIGWYALAQLSVVNVLTFTNSLFTDFRWSTFLMDPMMFILWTFVAVSLLLWGRGVFCGWLCPYGAAQDMVNNVARYFRVPQFNVPFAVHERLWALKYIILLALFAVSLHSLAQAEIYAEVEPFKTAVLMQFQREWGFVLYALALLAISAVNHKFFCRYICPLGAALAIPARIRLFAWLRRHPECGKPCQICANECEIQAIHPDGEINANECHYCLDCQVTYWNDRKCPPMINRRKRRERASRQAAESGEETRQGFPELEVPGRPA